VSNVHTSHQLTAYFTANSISFDCKTHTHTNTKKLELLFQIGEGEKLVKTLFGVASFYAPAVVFIDEIDSLLTQRKSDDNEASRRIKTEFLVQLDGTGTGGQGQVLVIGATNRPQVIVMNPGNSFLAGLIDVTLNCDQIC